MYERFGLLIDNAWRPSSGGADHAGLQPGDRGGDRHAFRPPPREDIGPPSPAPRAASPSGATRRPGTARQDHARARRTSSASGPRTSPA